MLGMQVNVRLHNIYNNIMVKYTTPLGQGYNFQVVSLMNCHLFFESLKLIILGQIRQKSILARYERSK